jgi:hypothetical protein
VICVYVAETGMPDDLHLYLSCDGGAGSDHGNTCGRTLEEDGGGV